MNFKHLVILCMAMALTNCASTSKQQVQSKVDKSSSVQVQHPPLTLERMDAQFLYLASQQALSQNQPSLAARFLKALVKSKPEELVPRFELADLLLTSGRKQDAQQAKSLMEGVSPETVASLSGEAEIQYQLLYARSLIANGDAEQAAVLLESVLKKQPERVEIRLLLARLHAVNKSYKKSHQILSQGLAIKKDLRLQQMQVRLYLQEAKFKQADKVLSAMQQDYPDHEDIVLQRAHLAEKQGMNIKAEALLQLYIDGHEDSAVQSYHMLAGIYIRQNRLGAATDVYKRMLPLTASDAEVLMSIGKLYYQQQKFEEAATYFGQAVEKLTPQQGDQKVGEELATASFYYGASLEASHQSEKAVVAYLKLQKQHSLYLDAQLRLVSMDIAQGDLKAAEQRILSLKESFSGNVNLYEILSSLRLQQKRYKDLIAESDKAVDLDYSRALLFNRAIAFESLKQFDEVDASLDGILARDPEDAETLNFYGYSLADRGVRLQDAQGMVEKALKAKPNDSYYLDSLAWVLFKKKEYHKALEKQLSAVQVLNDDPVMMEHLGDIYWKVGKAEQAKVSWQKALELEHEEPEKIQLKIEHGLM